MLTALAALAAVIGLYLHTRSTNQLREEFSSHLRAVRDTHAHELRKNRESLTAERSQWHQTMQAQHTALLNQLEQERRIAADERVQLLNRIKPDTFQPLLSQPAATGMVPPVGFDDDEGYRQALESRDELVERLEREMQAARVVT